MHEDSVFCHTMKDSNQPLRSDIFDKVLEQISSGVLPPGSRIVESRLAEEFGVSRTPVREALLHLEREGVVRSELSRGFLVNSLSRREIQETYPILWTLEGLAIRLGMSLLQASVPQLLALNAQFAAHAHEPAAARQADAEFHELLISRCGNSRLLSTIAHLRRKLGRYEQYYMQQADLIAISVKQHDEIIQAIAQGNLPQAQTTLEANWRFGMELMLEQLITNLAD